MRRRIQVACEAAGRDPAEVTLIAVTKGFPAEDIDILAELGVSDVGESRASEGRDKRSLVQADLTWHCIGQVQTNKAGVIVGWADVIHSIDRPRVIEVLSRAAVARAATLRVLVQVDLRQPHVDDGRGGCAPSDAVNLARQITEAPALRCAGVMAVAPVGEPPGPAFAALVRVAEEVQHVNPDATIISAGMSGDLEEAIAAGATHVRVGSAILGNRRAEV